VNVLERVVHTEPSPRKDIARLGRDGGVDDDDNTCGVIVISESLETLLSTAFSASSAPSSIVAQESAARLPKTKHMLDVGVTQPPFASVLTREALGALGAQRKTVELFVARLFAQRHFTFDAVERAQGQ
jgi:hypothetical protein